MVFTHGEGESNLLIPQHMFTVPKIDTACSLSWRIYVKRFVKYTKKQRCKLP